MRSMTIVFKRPAAPLRYQPIPEATLPRVSEAADPGKLHTHTEVEKEPLMVLPNINYIRLFLAYKGPRSLASKQQNDMMPS